MYVFVADQYKVSEFVTSVMPSAASAKTVVDLYMKHSMVFTNVPGPACTLSLITLILDSLYMYLILLLDFVTAKIAVCGVPVSDFEAAIGNIIPQLSAVSYDGYFTLYLSILWSSYSKYSCICVWKSVLDSAIRFNICVDPHLVTNAEHLSTCFYDELQSLEHALEL
jgi:hypothetical protein